MQRLEASTFATPMSALGQKQTFAPQKPMSAVTPNSGHVQCNSPCLLCANSGHSVIPIQAA